MSDIGSTPQSHGENSVRSPETQPERPWLYRKGQSGNPGGKPREGHSAPQLLRVMRHVTSKEEVRDRTKLQRECRAWLQEDRKSFLTKYADLERGLAASQAKAAATERLKELEADVERLTQENEELKKRLAEAGVGEEEPEYDPGTGRALGLLARLDKQWGKELAEIRKMTQPTAPAHRD